MLVTTNEKGEWLSWLDEPYPARQETIDIVRANTKAMDPLLDVVEVPPGLSPEHWYIHNGVEKRRPIMVIDPPRGVTTVGTPISLAGIPKGSLINIGGPLNDSFEHLGGALDLTFTLPGEYFLTATLWPYIGNGSQCSITVTQ